MKGKIRGYQRYGTDAHQKTVPTIAVMDEQMSLNREKSFSWWKSERKRGHPLTLVSFVSDALCVREWAVPALVLMFPTSVYPYFGRELGYLSEANDMEEGDIYFYAISMIDMANKVLAIRRSPQLFFYFTPPSSVLKKSDKTSKEGSRMLLKSRG
ncbi:hypothetical protein CDAR_509931 [Caerostris darwini]|uniref:Uncharacterized protein n=1 Tax=Caerostris darwini TaxID=1538125 RepID=A0AAV4TWN5_9ARAC|nr:hypothetical protein CDAR_509931 [Caerostris darwini]